MSLTEQHRPAGDAERVRDLILSQLADDKARNVVTLDIGDRSAVADYMVIASGSSSRHVRSMADELGKRLKAAHMPPLGVEGERDGEWVLVDANYVIVHLMLPRLRDFYNLERLWEVPARRSASGT